jgi:two-component system sensor histidine kinase/response regulator
VISRVLGRAEAVETHNELVTRHSIAEARRALHILLVEDNPLNQEVATALLERRGHTVDVVECGTDAVAAVLETAYDLVLMDIQLPGIDGVEATRRIRATSVGADLPIVALTAHALEQERTRAMDAGMNDFLTKPFRPHELFAVVEGWLPKGRYVDGVPGEAANDAPDEDVPDLKAPPVDIEGFRDEMREVGIESVVDESLALFESTAQERMDALVASGEAGDLEAAAREAHGFKSAAGTIRAMTLHALLDQIEDAANENDVGTVRELAAKAASACAAALAYISEQSLTVESA